jgi:hypothetical protein
VLDTKFVVRALPFHSTAEDDMKPVPVTVKVNPALPAPTELGLKELIAGVGFPPPPGLEAELEPHAARLPKANRHKNADTIKCAEQSCLSRCKGPPGQLVTTFDR